jgi:hypothetical protein
LQHEFEDVFWLWREFSKGRIEGPCLSQFDRLFAVGEFVIGLIPRWVAKEVPLQETQAVHFVDWGLMPSI